MTKPRNYIAIPGIRIPIPGVATNAGMTETSDFTYSKPFDFAPAVSPRLHDRIKAMWPAYEAKARELGVEPSWYNFQCTAERLLATADAAKLRDLDRDLAERVAVNSAQPSTLTADARERLAAALTNVVEGLSSPAHDPDLLRLARAFGCKPEDLEPSSEPDSREAAPDWIEARLRGDG